MGSTDFDPGGRYKPPSYANSVRNKKYEKLKRNVLQIVIEKKMQSHFLTLNGELVAGICEAVGLKPGVETEGYQVQYRGKSITICV